MKSKNWILAAVLVCLLGFPAFSQTPEQEVEAVIRSLFDGMRQKDAIKVADAFSPEGLMQTVQQKPEGTTVGCREGWLEGCLVGCTNGCDEGCIEGIEEGCLEGYMIGCLVG